MASPATAFSPPRGRDRTIAPMGCCLCGDDDGEPIAVGRDFARAERAESWLVLQCRECGVAYLARFDAAAGASAFASSERALPSAARSALASIVHSLPPGARILDVGCGDGSRLRELVTRAPIGVELDAIECDPALAREAEDRGIVVHRGVLADLERGPYDLVLFVHALGAQADPVAALADAADRLRPSGRVVIVTSNIASRAFRLFGGRHWAGYEFPRVRHWFDAAALSRTIERAGLRVDRLRGVPDVEMVCDSIANLFADWGARPWLRARVAPNAVVLPAILRAAGRLRFAALRRELLVADCRLAGHA